MKLIFIKEDNGDIKTQIQDGTVLIDFSYTEMVKKLLDSKEIDETEYVGLDDEEKEKIKEMLDQISDVFKDEESNVNTTESIMDDEDDLPF